MDNNTNNNSKNDNLHNTQQLLFRKDNLFQFVINQTIVWNIMWPTDRYHNNCTDQQPYQHQLNTNEHYNIKTSTNTIKFLNFALVLQLHLKPEGNIVATKLMTQISRAMQQETRDYSRIASVFLVPKRPLPAHLSQAHMNCLQISCIMTR
jgi:hypothetical protein